MRYIKSLGAIEYTHNDILTIEELKRTMIWYHYPSLSKEELEEQAKHRELIRADLKDSYGKITTTVFSVNGSPPKGIAIILHPDSFHQVILVGNGRVSRKYQIRISELKDD